MTQIFQKALEAALARGMTRIVVNATHEGVQVPAPYKKIEELPINLSYKFKGADIDFDVDAVRATLTFDERKFRCTFPYEAILLLAQPTTSDLPPKPASKSKLRLLK